MSSGGRDCQSSDARLSYVEQGVESATVARTTNGEGSAARERPVAVDLFAGAGGLSLGFEQAGFDVVAAVEIDPIHAAIHELNFPYGVTICDDIRRVSGERIRAAAKLGRRAVDVVIGGPPCQGFSLIGQRVLDDPRNTLVLHFLRLVQELRPRAFVMENVPGMATGAHTQLLTELIDGFREAGYRMRLPYRILNACHYGVPQDRRRLFLLGVRSDGRLPVYPEPRTRPRANGNGKAGNGSQMALLEELDECPSVWDAIGDLPDIEGELALLESDIMHARLEGGSLYARRLRGDAPDSQDFSYRRRRERGVLTGCRSARHTDLSRQRFEATVPGSTEEVSRFFRLPENGVCNTLRAGTATDRGAFTAPRPIHPRFPRCISVREAARLHSYPDWFRFHRTVWHGFRQIGNSVPPLLGRAVGRAMLTALGEEPVRSAVDLGSANESLADYDMREAAAHFGVDSRIIAPRKRVAVAVGG